MFGLKIESIENNKIKEGIEIKIKTKAGTIVHMISKVVLCVILFLGFTKVVVVELAVFKKESLTLTHNNQETIPKIINSIPIISWCKSKIVFAVIEAGS